MKIENKAAPKKENIYLFTFILALSILFNAIVIVLSFLSLFRMLPSSLETDIMVTIIFFAFNLGLDSLLKKDKTLKTIHRAFSFFVTAFFFPFYLAELVPYYVAHSGFIVWCGYLIYTNDWEKRRLADEFEKNKFGFAKTILAILIIPELYVLILAFQKRLGSEEAI